MQILNKLKQIFSSMRSDGNLYTYIDGSKYVQAPNVESQRTLDKNSLPPVITPLNIGFTFNPGFLRDSTIEHNIKVIDTLLVYSAQNVLVSINRSRWNKNIWKVKVISSDLVIFENEIRFSDSKFWELQLLKLKYSVK